MQKKNKLIINADDYGLSSKFNKGILELAKAGKITGLSAMIKRKFVKAKDFKNLKNISIGLHLELEEKDTKKEIESQFKKFQKVFGKLPSHLDGHKYLHLTKDNLPKVIPLAKKYNLPIRSREIKDRRIIKKSGLKTPDQFISWYPERKTKLFLKLKNLKSKTAELVCHPGYYDKNSKSSYNIQREKELKIIRSIAFKQAISKFELINYLKL